MVIPPLAQTPHLVATPAQRPKDQYTLVGGSDGFLVGNGARIQRIEFRLPETSLRELSFRKNDRWVVWDERGLTTRDGEWKATDRFETIPLSPKLQTKPQIVATLAAVKAGKRSLAAAGMSGARRIGTLVYLLLRWEDAAGVPWLEALVVVDLAQPHPKARLLGAFGGLSLGRGLADNRLGIEEGRLAVSVNSTSAWGTATYDPKRSRFEYVPRGVRLLAQEEDRLIEATSYGTTLAGRVAGGRTIPWLEVRGPASFVPGPGSVLVRCGDRLRNANTGAELRLAPDAALRRTSAGLLVYWPEASPRSARLYDVGRFEERARWEQGTKGLVNPLPSF